MNWKDFEGKKVYIRLRNGRVYSGNIKSIDDNSPPIVFINLIDKFGNLVMFVHSEILELREET